MGTHKHNGNTALHNPWGPGRTGRDLVLGNTLPFSLLTKNGTLVLSLLMVTFPYVLFICMVAFAMAVLNSLKHFLTPALAPVALNICWIMGVMITYTGIREYIG